MNITIQNYQQAVAHFASPLELKEHNAHMAMGIAEEFQELEEARDNYDEVNAAEEAGDMAWFVSQYCQANGMNFAELMQQAIQDYGGDDESKQWSGECPWKKLLTLSKKELAYTGYVPTPEQRLEAIQIVCQYIAYVLFDLYEGQQNPLERILQTNFNKLDGRYKGQAYSTDNAINRDLDKERQILEGAHLTDTDPGDEQ